MPEQIFAPWTPAQVDALNRWQRSGHVHPFTCGQDHEGDRDLVATTNGWICPNCDYKQTWAHASMLFEPRSPFEAIFREAEITPVKSILMTADQLFSTLSEASSNFVFDVNVRRVFAKQASRAARISNLLKLIHGAQTNEQ